MASNGPVAGLSATECGWPWWRLRMSSVSAADSPWVQELSSHRPIRVLVPTCGSALPDWPLLLLDGESQLSEHRDGATLPAFEIAGAKALARGEFISGARPATAPRSRRPGPPWRCAGRTADPAAGQRPCARSASSREPRVPGQMAVPDKCQSMPSPGRGQRASARSSPARRW
jgi:hypothetical protein